MWSKKTLKISKYWKYSFMQVLSSYYMYLSPFNFWKIALFFLHRTTTTFHISTTPIHENTQLHEKNEWVWILVLLGTVAIICLPVIMFCIKKKTTGKLATNNYSTIFVIFYSDEHNAVSFNCVLVLQVLQVKISFWYCKTLDINLVKRDLFAIL